MGGGGQGRGADEHLYTEHVNSTHIPMSPGESHIQMRMDHTGFAGSLAWEMEGHRTAVRCQENENSRSEKMPGNQKGGSQASPRQKAPLKLHPKGFQTLRHRTGLGGTGL